MALSPKPKIKKNGFVQLDVLVDNYVPHPAFSLDFRSTFGVKLQLGQLSCFPFDSLFPARVTQFCNLRPCGYAGV